MTQERNNTVDAVLRFELAQEQMSVLAAIRTQFGQSKPLAGHRLALCGHITAETAVQAVTLVELGADVAWCASSTTTTDDGIAEVVRGFGMTVLGQRGMSDDDLIRGAEQVLETWPEGPTLVLDEGAVLITELHQKMAHLPAPVLATEKTPDGLHKLAEVNLRFPVIKSDESFGKNVIDNPHGTAQSLVETIMSVSGKLLAGKVFVVIGYGRVGAGLAAKARGLGARVIVTEVRPTRALLAVMDGYEVLPLAQAAGAGDFFCTVTGAADAIRREHFGSMKSGAVLANGGHLPWEIDLEALGELTISRAQLGSGYESLTISDGRKLYLVGGGYIANLSAGRGNASEVMDVTFASQVLALHLALPTAGSMLPGLHPLPPQCDEYVAAALARRMGIHIDEFEAR